MIVYGDRSETISPPLALQRLRRALALATCPPLAMQADHMAPRPCEVPDERLLATSLRHSALVELLIEAGTLEQATADALCPFVDRPMALPPVVSRVTDLAAAAVARSHDALLVPASHHAPASWWQNWQVAMEMALNTIGQADLPPLLRATVPEGYLFYALYPESYLLCMRRALATLHDGAGHSGPPVVIIGVRSIGTSLGAMAAAACQESGLAHWRISMRPHGDAFDRFIAADEALVRHLRTWAGRGALFVAVDEGPGLSGSSLAAVARFLVDGVGVSADRVALLCANPWPGPQMPDWAVPYWTTSRRWVVDPLVPTTGNTAVGAAFTAALGIPAGQAVIADLSGGAWRMNRLLPDSVVTAHPRFERRKYLCRGHDGGTVWAKFIGLGRIGRAKAARAAELSAVGLTPRYLGYAHGFLLSQAVDAAPLVAAQAGQPDLPRVASYIAYTTQSSRPDEGERTEAGASRPFDRLYAMVTHNTRAWFGPTLDPELAALARWQRAVDDGFRHGGDGKPQPHEWLATSPWVKCDAADHHLDHGAVWPLDPCYDLAGTSYEWALESAGVDCLVRRYVEQSADWQAPQRLPFYHAVYCAALLGQHDLAYHLERANPAEAVRYDHARRRYADGLRLALLTAGPVAPSSDLAMAGREHLQ